MIHASRTDVAGREPGLEVARELLGASEIATGDYDLELTVPCELAAYTRSEMTVASEYQDPAPGSAHDLFLRANFRSFHLSKPPKSPITLPC